MEKSPPLRQAYRLLRARFGHQHWWPGETPFEVCVGAILVQNTAWSNVEKAIAALKAAGVMSPRALHALRHSELAALIRPAGYFNVKARRLAAFLRVLNEEFGGRLDRLFAGETSEVRRRLLNIHGIGPETADSLLLYAGGHASFVVDAYTKRIFLRHGWCKPDDDYAALQGVCTRALSQQRGAALLDYWQDFHAQLVAVGKEFCRTREPECTRCPLAGLLQKPSSHVKS